MEIQSVNDEDTPCSTSYLRVLCMARCHSMHVAALLSRRIAGFSVSVLANMPLQPVPQCRMSLPGRSGLVAPVRSSLAACTSRIEEDDQMHIEPPEVRKAPYTIMNRGAECG